MKTPSPAATEVRTSRTGARFTISIRGRFDFSCHQEFRKAYEQIEPCTEIDVDLSQVDYLDSSALGMMLVLKDEAHGKPIRVVGCRPAVKRILDIANFGRIFPITAGASGA